MCFFLRDADPCNFEEIRVHCIRIWNTYPSPDPDPGITRSSISYLSEAFDTNTFISLLYMYITCVFGHRTEKHGLEDNIPLIVNKQS